MAKDYQAKRSSGRWVVPPLERVRPSGTGADTVRLDNSTEHSGRTKLPILSHNTPKNLSLWRTVV